MKHFNEDELIDYVLRDEFQMPERQVKEVESHLQHCPDCLAAYGRLAERYRQVHTMKDAAGHFEELAGKPIILTKSENSRSWIYRAAAVVLLLVLPYGLSVWLMNRSFDRGPLGLEAFQLDYKFALAPESYRGDQPIANGDVKLFKQGVLAIFGAKTTTLGLFPHYEAEKLKAAESYFLEAKRISRNPDVIYKVDGYLKKIELIRSAEEE